MVARSRRAVSYDDRPARSQNTGHSSRPSRRFGAARVCRRAMAGRGYPGGDFAPWLDGGGHGERERWGASPAASSAPHAPPAPPRYGAQPAALYDPRAGAHRSGHPGPPVGPYAAHSSNGSRHPPPLPGLHYAPPPASAAWSRSAAPPPRGHYAPPPPLGYHALPAVRALAACKCRRRPAAPPAAPAARTARPLPRGLRADAAPRAPKRSTAAKARPARAAAPAQTFTPLPALRRCTRPSGARWSWRTSSPWRSGTWRRSSARAAPRRKRPQTLPSGCKAQQLPRCVRHSASACVECGPRCRLLTHRLAGCAHARR